MIPMRYVFRSKWTALAWAAGICLSAASFVGDKSGSAGVDAANSADGNAAQAAALDAELN